MILSTPIIKQNNIQNIINYFINHEQTAAIEYKGHFICGLIYNENKQKWYFIFNNFESFPSDDDILLSIFKDVFTNNIRYYNVIYFPDKQGLISIVQEHIRKDCLKYIQSDNGNLPLIIKDAKPDLGKPVKFFKKCGILIGVSATLEDYYYYILNSNKELEFHSCVGGYELIDNVDEYPELKSVMKDPNLNEIIKTKSHDHFHDAFEIEVINY